MQEKTDSRYQGEVTTEGVSGRLEKITELKEALKHVRGMSEEMSLLSDLTQEISALRRLLEPGY
jgi:hypothetical protein